MSTAAALRVVLLSALLVVAPRPAGAALDQSQETWNAGLGISSYVSGWQVFTPAIGGLLLGVDLDVETDCFLPPLCSPTPVLNVRIVGVDGGGVPLPGVVLGSATVPSAAAPGGDVIHVDFSAASIVLTAGQRYAIELTSTIIANPQDGFWRWHFDDGGNPYADGALFIDGDSANGLDDPVADINPNSDAAFRTHMEPGVCGDGVPNTNEECDDGNTAIGDNCSPLCLNEVCGDGVVNNVSETCDDGDFVDGDGCTAGCTLEKSALACHTAILKGGQRYATVRLAALSKCRAAFAAGKPLSVVGPRTCADEIAATKSITKARAALRKTIANGNKPKCTDALVAPLGACADTVADLISADATSGCLLTTHDAAVEALIEAQAGE